MADLSQLVREKSDLLLALEAAKAARERSAIADLASRVAALEGQIARLYLAARRPEDAVINLLSEVSCLVDGNRRVEAARVLETAARHTTLDSVRNWIAQQRKQLPSTPLPAVVFTSEATHIDGNSLLRRPQLEAYRAAKSHFTTSDEHALIQLPVGCGKTGTMSLMPFAISNGRVLIVAPNLEIAGVLAKNFDYSNVDCFWRKTRVLANGHGPTCAVLDSEANLGDCDASDMVVTNIQQLVASDADKWLARLPPDYFDMVLIDEGHHAAATSWQRVLERFPDAKVTSFTATPIRSDGQKVEGKRIYRFPIGDAIREGFVRDIASRRLEPTEIYFEYRGQRKRHTLAEVLKLREEEWFSKGVALAPECNRHIVDASIQCMRELREAGHVNHQIIAAACSIDHANAIRSLYSERNCRAEVLHSKLKDDQQSQIRAALERGDLDVIVHVQMLGEGADYPQLGVAAIFRPYRHLVPYVQFVGRIMRVPHQNHPGHPDNRGFIVCHVGLNVDRWWEELRDIDKDDQEFFEAVAQGQRDFAVPTGDPKEETPEPRRRFSPTMKVIDETINFFVQEHFLPEDSRAVVDDLVRAMELRGIAFEALGLSREQLAQKLLETAAKKEKRGTVVPGVVQPQRARKEARKRLDERVRSAAKQLLNELQIRTMGYDLPRLFASTGATNNLAAAIVLVNLEVIEFLRVGPDERDALTTDQLKLAHDSMDEIVDRIAQKVRTKQDGETEE